MPFQLSPDVAVTDIDDGLVLLHQRTGRYWQLNPTGTTVLRSLLAGQSVSGAAEELTARYQVEGEQALSDVAALVAGLRAARLLGGAHE
jgi:Coenzyme PQQ synthesis protein D (PqqD)